MNLAILVGIAGFKSDNLKPTETVEKNVLPDKEEIKTEKTIQGVLEGVKGFESEKLKNVKTREPSSPLAVVQVLYQISTSDSISIMTFHFRLRRQENQVSLLSMILIRQH